MTRYAVITPVRDEEQHIEKTIRSVCTQAVLPAEWVIVDDGSTDRTGFIIDEYARQLPWIKTIHRSNRGFRKAGGGVVDAFNEGYKSIRSNDWEFIVKLDGDLSFSPDYFERCFEHFEKQPDLGIGGGEIYHNLDGKLIVDANPRFHVRGATKIYRKACWKALGGLMAAPGWDTIDEVKANMMGWKTRSFKDLKLVHHRLTGTAEGLLHDRVKQGLACYTCGYHPIFAIARCVYRLATRPYVIGSIAMFFGFLRGYFAREPRVDDERLIYYLRGQQIRRLLGLKTVWR